LAAALAKLAHLASGYPSKPEPQVAVETDDALRDLIDALAGSSASRMEASSAVDNAPSSSAESDRRAFPRRDSRSVRLVVHRWNDTRSATEHDKQWLLHSSQARGRLLDVSRNGVAFLYSEALKSGDHLIVRMSNPLYDQPIDKPAVVLRSSRIGDGQWKTICRFQRNLTFDEVYVLGRPLVSPSFV
jgi:hypothetical protein